MESPKRTVGALWRNGGTALRAVRGALKVVKLGSERLGSTGGTLRLELHAAGRASLAHLEGLKLRMQTREPSKEDGSSPSGLRSVGTSPASTDGFGRCAAPPSLRSLRVERLPARSASAACVARGQMRASPRWPRREDAWRLAARGDRDSAADRSQPVISRSGWASAPKASEAGNWTSRAAFDPGSANEPPPASAARLPTDPRRGRSQRLCRGAKVGRTPVSTLSEAAAPARCQPRGPVRCPRACARRHRNAARRHSSATAAVGWSRPRQEVQPRHSADRSKASAEDR